MKINDRRKKEVSNSKREDFLSSLERVSQRALKVGKYTGPGWKRKIKRLLFTPGLYIPYLLTKFGLYPIRKNVRTKLFWGKEIKVDLGKDPDAFTLYYLNCLKGQEIKLTKFFIKNLKPEDVFYDIGASYGFYSYLAFEFCNGVHAFEPIPFVFQGLVENLKNEKVVLNQKAVSDKQEETEIYMRGGSFASTINKENLNQDADSIDNINIRTITLDKYVKNHANPTVIKLDVEGAENKVIQGGENFFKKHSPLITMEVLPEEKVSMRAVEKLRSYGYKSHFIQDDGSLQKVHGNLIKKVEESRFSVDNFIFKKR